MSADSSAMHRLSARSLIIPAALTFAAVLWWAGRGGDVAPENSSAGEPERANESGTSFGSSSSRESRSATVETTASPGVDSEDVSDVGFRDYVAAKYRFLFKGMGLSPEETAALSARLLEREHIAVAINTARQSNDPSAREAIPRHQAELEAADRKVSSLLRPGDLAAYEVLKDSDIEQFQLDDVAWATAQTKSTP